MKSIDLSHCYGCGTENPSGLHLKKTFDGNKVRIEFIVGPEYAGYPGLMHGGVTCILFDEVMFHVIARKEVVAVIANMNVDYRSPALVGDLLICEAWIVKHEGRKIDVEAKIVNGKTNSTIAEARGLFIEVDLNKLLKV